MTEFELAQLEFMQSERNANLLDLVLTQSGLVQNDATQFSTLIRGFRMTTFKGDF